MSSRQLLTLELGCRCNNRCSFCPQHHLRTGVLEPHDLTTRQAIARIREGRRRKLTRIAFTGGEPTARGDLATIIAKAAEAGFREIGITSNGRMLSVRDTAEELLDAGLNRISFSLHSARRVLHDSLTGARGCFDQLKRGLGNVVELADRKGLDLKLHSITLLVPQTVGHVDETVELAAALGAEIHIVQPFIASRTNLHVATDYFVGYPEIASAIAKAGVVASRKGTRLKPYNIPYCILESLEAIELQEYQLQTHKRQERRAADDRGFAQTQFYGIDRCPTCPTPCPGFRMEHYPRERMVKEIVSDVAKHRSGNLVLSGLDLLPAEPLRKLLSEFHRTDRPVVPVTGGNMWCEQVRFADVLAGLGIPRVVHLLRTDWSDRDAKEPEQGNEGALLKLAGLLKERGVSNSLLVSVLDLPSFAMPFESIASRFDEILVAVPRIWRGLAGEDDVGRRLDEVGGAALNCAENLHQVVRLSMVIFDSVRVLPRSTAIWQKAFSSRFGSADWSGSLVRHRFASTAYNYVMWSVPFWLF